MTRALIPLAFLAGCGAALQPAPDDATVTGFATEACSRRIAQLAAPYHAKGIASRVSDEAVVLPDGRYRLGFTASVDYGNEQRTGRIVCTVTAGGRVDQIEAK